ncbi:MAG TPA: ribokinase, partial [Spirochaetia bacterium]|nr:ribokinase [Spirochaetia bacterium]
MAKLVVVGDFNADIVLYFDRFPRPGETINAKGFFEGPGGKGSNQAVAAARLGADVTFVGAIGNDHYGRIAMDAWTEAGVDTSLVLHSDSVPTAVAMIYVDAAGDNTIGVNQAANLTLEPARIDAIADTIAEADMLMCTLGVSIDVVGRALSVAKHSGTKTLLNPAPAATLPRAVLDAADYITPNEHELAEMLGGDGDLVTSARKMLSRDDQTAVVTLGRAGARWITSTETEQVGAFSVDAIDTVGAG